MRHEQSADAPGNGHLFGEADGAQRQGEHRRLLQHESLSARTFLVGERLDTRALERAGVVASAPAMLAIGRCGCAALFRYGVVVLFDVSAADEASFLASLGAFVSDPLDRPEGDQVRLVAQPQGDEQVDPTGTIVVKEISIERLQAVAEILAKNALLSHYESTVAEAFDRIEPLAAELRKKGRTGRQPRELLRHIGDVLLTEHKMVGRAEASEKPELLWEHPELERLYGRLEAEYELRDRARALEAKLDLISRTCETLLALVQNQRTARIEWFIVVLICAELLLTILTLTGAVPRLN
jgi:uncharacterized Rmd1/YagE family protein